MNDTHSTKKIFSIIGLIIVIIICCGVIYFEINRTTDAPGLSAVPVATSTLPAGHVMMTDEQIVQKQAIIDQVENQSPATLTPAQAAAKEKYLKQLQGGK